MSNITVRKDTGSKLTRPAIPAEWEPFRVMRSLMNWDPFGEMVSFPLAEERAASFIPDFEIKETKDSYLFKADVPGVKESDLDVTVAGNRLSVSGKRDAENEEQTDTFYAYERSYGQFTRAFTLPEGADVDRLNAEMKDGVLSIRVPKKTDVQPRKVTVKPAGSVPAAKS